MELHVICYDVKEPKGKQNRTDPKPDTKPTNQMNDDNEPDFFFFFPLFVNLKEIQNETNVKQRQLFNAKNKAVSCTLSSPNINLLPYVCLSV